MQMRDKGEVDGWTDADMWMDECWKHVVGGYTHALLVRLLFQIYV